MNVVLDTNVLVSGLITHDSPPFKVVDLLLLRKLHICWDDRILAEYVDVLSRPKFKIDPEEKDHLLQHIQTKGSRIRAPFLHIPMKDPSDLKFLEVANVTHPHLLITGNLKHYPLTMLHRVKVMSPADFLRWYLK